MDGSAVVKNLKLNALTPATGTATTYNVGAGGGERRYFKGFTCPDDVDSHQAVGGLSYVVNMGMISSTVWDGVYNSAAAPFIDTFPAAPDVTADSSYHHPGLISWDGNGGIGSTSDQARGGGRSS